MSVVIAVLDTKSGSEAAALDRHLEAPYVVEAMRRFELLLRALPTVEWLAAIGALAGAKARGRAGSTKT